MERVNNNINWGGSPELIALSNIYNVNINVYIAWSYSKRYNKVIKGITIIINDKNSDAFCDNELIINKGEKQQANVDHDINTRLKTFLLSFIAI